MMPDFFATTGPKSHLRCRGADGVGSRLKANNSMRKRRARERVEQELDAVQVNMHLESARKDLPPVSPLLHSPRRTKDHSLEQAERRNLRRNADKSGPRCSFIPCISSYSWRPTPRLNHHILPKFYSRNGRLLACSHLRPMATARWQGGRAVWQTLMPCIEKGASVLHPWLGMPHKYAAGESRRCVNCSRGCNTAY